MTTKDLVHLWKDPDAPGGRIDHPAGEIELYHGGGNGVAAKAVETEKLLSLGCCQTVSPLHTLCCRDTVVGTCGYLSVGCCD